MAAVASLAIAGAIGFGAVTTGTAPVLADAVHVQAPQVPSFADVVERVSPAVVSVKVKAKVQPASDDGSDMFQGPEGLPDNPQLREFFRQFRGFGNRGDHDRNDGKRFHRDHKNDKPRPVAQGSGFFISEGLRCMVCQNQSIDESDADLARDLRLLVRERLTAGDSDAQVVDYVVSRYGEFVLLKPRLSMHTILLWAAPLLLLLAGGLAVLFSARSRRREAPSLSPEEQARLEAILHEN
jgi:cytochrome c-type biogenesis protein CcmH/NrfF